MTAYIMFDDVNLDLIPADAEVIGVYIDGRYKDLAAAKARFPKAKFVTIAISANDDADVLDVEPGNAGIADIYRWLKRQLGRGVWRPAVYISVGSLDKMMLTMNANGFLRSQYRIWSAHYGAGEHICGPSTCRLTREPCDWTQWTDWANGKSLDESDLGKDNPVFTKPAPAPAPTPVAPVIPVITEVQAAEALKELGEFVTEHK